MELVYHGTSKPIENGRLEPRPEHYNGEHVGDFVFATDSLQKALTYTLRDKTDPKRWSAVLHNEGVPLIITPTHSSYFDDSLTGVVYNIPRDGFEKYTHAKAAPDEWVSKNPVPLDQPGAMKVTNANQAMQEGVQLFLVQGDIDASKKVFEDIKQLRGVDQWHAFLKDNIARGVIVHENAQRGLKPLNLDVPPAAAAVVTKSDLTRKIQDILAQGPGRPPAARILS